MTPLAPADLDDAYTRLCHTMTRLGEAQATIFLARLALLALARAEGADAARRLIDDAESGLAAAEDAPQ